MKANNFWGIEYAKESYYQIILVRICTGRAMNNSVRSAVLKIFGNECYIIREWLQSVLCLSRHPFSIVKSDRNYFAPIN